MRPHTPTDLRGDFNPAAFCPECRYALDPWMPRCPECGDVITSSPRAAAGRAWQSSAPGLIAAHAILYAALMLGLCW